MWVIGQVMMKETDEEWKLVEKRKQGTNNAQQEYLRGASRRDEGAEELGDDDDKKSEEMVEINKVAEVVNKVVEITVDSGAGKMCG